MLTFAVVSLYCVPFRIENINIHCLNLTKDFAQFYHFILGLAADMLLETIYLLHSLLFKKIERKNTIISCLIV